LIVTRLFKTLLLLFPWFFGSAYAGELPVFKVCLDHFPPRQVLISGEPPRGQNVEIAKALGKLAGFTPLFSENVSFKRCLTHMREGTADLMIGLVETSTRSRYMAFVPYMKESKKRFFSLSSNNIDINNLSDLDGLHIAVVEGFSYTEKIKVLLTKTEFTEVSTLKKAFSLAARQKVDAVFASEYVDIELDASVVNAPVFVASSYALHAKFDANIAVSKKSAAVKHISKLSHAAEQLNERGIIDAIINQSKPH